MNKNEKTLYCVVSMISNKLADMGDRWAKMKIQPATPVKKALALKLTCNAFLDAQHPTKNEIRAMVNTCSRFEYHVKGKEFDARTSLSILIAILEMAVNKLRWTDQLNTMHRQLVALERYYSYRRKNNIEKWREAEYYIKRWEMITI